MTTPFLARIATMQAPVIPAPVRTDYAHAVPVAKPQRAKVDIAKVIDEMGDWAGDTHDLPATLALDL